VASIEDLVRGAVPGTLEEFSQSAEWGRCAQLPDDNPLLINSFVSVQIVNLNIDSTPAGRFGESGVVSQDWDDDRAWQPAPALNSLELEAAADRRSGAILNELHDLLCGGADYEDDRKRFLEQFSVGQAGFGTAVTTVLVPVLGQTAPVIGACVALSFALIGKIGMRSWCQIQRSRRQRGASVLEPGVLAEE
jgi:hypothetical protein